MDTALPSAASVEDFATLNRRFTAIHTISQAFNACIDLRCTLRVILEQLAEQLPASAGDIWLINGQTHELEFAAGHGQNVAATLHPGMALGDGLAGQVAQSRQKLFITDLAARQAGTPAEEGYVSYCGLPLIHKGVMRGVLQVFWRQPAELKEDQELFLDVVTNLAILTVENAASIQNYERISQELFQATSRAG